MVYNTTGVFAYGLWWWHTDIYILFMYHNTKDSSIPPQYTFYVPEIFIETQTLLDKNLSIALLYANYENLYRKVIVMPSLPVSVNKGSMFLYIENVSTAWTRIVFFFLQILCLINVIIMFGRHSIQL